MSIQTVQPDLYFSVDIAGHEEQPDGSVVVYGIPCKPDTLDVDGQRVDPDWLKGALGQWYQTGPNIREMHQPSAVGVGQDLDWDGDTPLLTAKIVDPTAVTKVKHGVYRAFSIGVKNHVLKMNDPQAPNGRIVGGQIVETSVVDRPAIPGSDILDFKGDLFKIASALSPSEVLDHQNGVVWQRLGVVEGALAKRDVDPNVGGGVDRDKIPAEDFAGKDRSFPIVTPGDVSDAASSIGGAGDDNYPAEKLKENIIRIAHRKGSAYEAELPEAWNQNDKEATVDESTDKTADQSAEKTVDAATELKSADGEEVKDAEAGLEEAADADGGDKPNPLADLEAKAARSTFCVACGKSVEIEDGKTVEHDGHSFLVGKDAAGHQLQKFVVPDESKSAADEAAAEAALEAVDAIVDNALDNDDEDGDGDGSDASDDAPVAVDESPAPAAAPFDGEDAMGDGMYAATGDLLKTALTSLLLDAGIDLGMVGRRMAKGRLERFNAAIDELKSLAAELGDGGSLGKAAQSGSDLYTRMQACISEIAGLARQMANPGSDVEDTEEGGSDMGRASGINPSDQSLARSADSDLTKTPKAGTQHPSAQEQAEALAKAVAPALEKALEPLADRLGKVEHTLVPAAPPVLAAEERGSAFVGKQADARRMAHEEALTELGKMSQTEREHVVARLLADSPDWRR